MGEQTVTLQWRGETLEFAFDRETETVGALAARIGARTRVPVERMTLMVSGWRLKKPATMLDVPLRECTGDGQPRRGTLMGTPAGEEFVQKPAAAAAAASPAAAAAPPPLARGYTNLGNTCYFNAVLALLENAPPLRRALVDAPPALDHPLVRRLQDLWRTKAPTAPANPSDLVRLLITIHPAFAQRSPSNPMVNQQQDADECMTVLFNQLETAQPQAADLFRLHLRQTTRPEGSDGPAETALQESLKLPCYPGTPQAPVSSLVDGLRLGFCEKLDKQDASGVMVAHTRTSQLTQTLPELLIIHLVRFEWKRANDAAGTRARRAKVLRRIEYPTKLDVFEFCDESLQAALAVGRQEDEERRKAELEDAAGGAVEADAAHADGVYRLRSVVTHRGRTVEEGHYICWNWSESDQTWTKLDDDKSSVVPRDAVDLQGGIADGHVPYLLLYERQGRF